MLELRALHITQVFLKPLTNVLQRVFVAGHLVSALCVVPGCTRYLLLTLHAQTVANLTHYGHDDIVKQRMALHIEIGGLRGDTQRLDVVLHFQVLFLVVRIQGLQLPYLRRHLMAQVVNGILRIEDIEPARINNPRKVGKRKVTIVPCTVSPYALYEEREDCLAVPLQVIFEVEDAVVVQRHHDTDLMK